METKTQNQVLRLVVDFPPRLHISQFAAAVDCLAVMSDTCRSMVVPDTREANVGASWFPDIVIIRSSVGSPWTSILQDAAASSVPAGYGLTAIHCLRQLLRMVMDWQNHGRDLRASDELRRAELAVRLGEFTHDIRQRQDVPRQAEFDNPADREHFLSQLEELIPRLGAIRSVDIIDEDEAGGAAQE
jgi:hypothetical protein